MFKAVRILLQIAVDAHGDRLFRSLPTPHVVQKLQRVAWCSRLKSRLGGSPAGSGFLRL
jgi:hypothetical protein